MNHPISIIIPNYNKAATIGKCLEAALASRYEPFEVIAVDDNSCDNSVEIIRQYPCQLIQLQGHSGVSTARNTGARNSCGRILFFTDADCLIQPDTLSMINKIMQEDRIKILGGSYTPIPYDCSFFSLFQSVFINYLETRHSEPDYLAAHALAIESELFKKTGGFSEQSFFGKNSHIEDVEFSHQLKAAGYRLHLSPEVMVQHIFNLSLWRSMQNAFRKSMFWIIYSLQNRDILSDSGCASRGLKLNGIFLLLIILFILSGLRLKDMAFFCLATGLFGLNLFLNRGLVRAFYRTGGIGFGLAASLYYTLIYPLPLWAGTAVGLIRQQFSLWKKD